MKKKAKTDELRAAIDTCIDHLGRVQLDANGYAPDWLWPFAMAFKQVVAAERALRGGGYDPESEVLAERTAYWDEERRFYTHAGVAESTEEFTAAATGWRGVLVDDDQSPPTVTIVPVVGFVRVSHSDTRWLVAKGVHVRFRPCPQSGGTQPVLSLGPGDCGFDSPVLLNVGAGDVSDYAGLLAPGEIDPAALVAAWTEQKAKGEG